MKSSADPKLFAFMMGMAVHYIAAAEGKNIKVIQDEIGYDVGRNGASPIDYWRRGHIPERAADVEQLARIFVSRKGFQHADELRQFLDSAQFAHTAELCRELFPQETMVTGKPPGIEVLMETAPFLVGPPVQQPRQFFGREQQLKRIFGLLARFPLQHIALIGPRRSGKTSLLHYLKNIGVTPPHLLRPGQKSDWLPQPEAYRWAFVDFQNARLHQQETLLQHILAELGLPAPSPCSLSTFMEIMSTQLTAPSIILMDEIERAFRLPGLDQDILWESLRSLAGNAARGRLGLILACKDYPYRLAAQVEASSSPFLNIFGHAVDVGAFTESEACEFITTTLLPFLPAASRADDLEWIVEKSQCWPVLLQTLCQARFNALEEAGEAWKAEALKQILPYGHLVNHTG